MVVLEREGSWTWVTSPYAVWCVVTTGWDVWPGLPLFQGGEHEDGGRACRVAQEPHLQAHLVHYQQQVEQQMGAVTVVSPLTHGEHGGASPFMGVALHQVRPLGVPQVVFGPCTLTEPLAGHRHLP